jgi:hypothetical protein
MAKAFANACLSRVDGRTISAMLWAMRTARKEVCRSGYTVIWPLGHVRYAEILVECEQQAIL